MNFKFWRKSPQPETRQVKTLGVTHSGGKFLIFGAHGGETPTSALELYRESTAVSIPINKIATPFSAIRPVLKDMQTGEITTNHSVLSLLQNPSPFYDSCLFFETLAKDYLVTNETEIVALGNINRPPAELQPISPKNVSVNEGEGGTTHSFSVSSNTLPGDYVQTRVRSEFRYYDGNLRELKQIRGYSTRNNALLRGQSPLVQASAEARQHILGNTHNIALLRNGGRASLVFHYEEDLGEDDFNEVKERVDQQFAGASKAGKIIVTAGGKLQVEELGKSNRDMDYATLQRMAMDSVALQYQVPLPLVSSEANTFNNFREAKVALYDDAILPLADRIYGGLSVFLLPRFGLDPSRFQITYDILSIPALRMRALEEIKLRKDINIESDNELRPLIAREAYNGGDVILKPANLVPVGSDTETDEPVVMRDLEDE